MASSSASFLHKRFKYDVFLSFRGEDVRKTFVDHLYASLDRQCIRTFKDDKRLKKGERIDKELIESIRDSKFFIIVFSQNYADSSWCLNELVEIMECQKNTTEQIAYPVFYDLDPSEVRKQEKSYGKALAKHNNNKNKKDVEKWRKALLEAGSLSGYDVKNTCGGHEARVIEKIVAEISRLLCSTYYLSNDEKLVGMETRIPHLLSCLDIKSNDVRMIGITGMGGAGKTTLARAIFERISFHFEGVSFVDNVRENSKNLQSLQQKILCDVLKEKGITIGSFVDGKRMMKNRLCGIKTLVVLDDVDHIEQLDELAGAHDWFKPGSRIIITTRNEQVLVAHGVDIKHVSLLSDKEAIHLFKRHAFKGDITMEGYEEHSRKVVDYAAGLPLTVKVLGCLLCGQVESVWIDVLKRLETIPLKETQDILELSYNSLENDHKEIFLDVACLMKGWKKTEAITMLESRGFHATCGLRVLEQKSLITYSSLGGDDDMHLDMHDHIQEMGKNIVRRGHPNEPKEHSRLWITEDIEYIFCNNLGTEATRCIKMFQVLHPEVIMEGLQKMNNLRVLRMNGYPVYSFPHKPCDIRSAYFPNDLQYLFWNFYPFCSLPKRFEANSLVSLIMRHSKIKQLWESEEKKVLKKLKFLDLKFSELTKFNVQMTPNLEVLNLEECRNLLELDMSIGCPKLTFLVLSGSPLMKFELGRTPNLDKLEISSCALEELKMPSENCLKLRSLVVDSFHKCETDYPWLIPNLERLSLHGRQSKLLKLQDVCIESRKLTYLEIYLVELRTLDLRLCSNLKFLKLDHFDPLQEFYMPASCLELTHCEISFAKLKTLDLGLTANLKFFKLDNCDHLEELHMPASCLELTYCEINHAKLKTLDLGLTPNLKFLKLDRCDCLEELHMPASCLELTHCEINHAKLKTLDLGLTPNLKFLKLDHCDPLEELHMPASCLELTHCEINHAKLKTLDLGRTPNLNLLMLKICHDLEELHMRAGFLKKLTHLHLEGCPGLKSFVLTKEQESYESLPIHPLDSNHGMPTNSMSCFYKQKTSTSREYLEKLISLDTCCCSNLGNIIETADWLPNLKKVFLGCGIPKVPEYDGQLEYIEELKFSCPQIRLLPYTSLWSKDLRSLKLEHCTSLMELPNDICRSRHLKSLHLVCCSSLRALPWNLGDLEFLEDLVMQECESLESIPDSICKLKYLKRFHLTFCVAVEKLPEEIGDLKSLTELNIVGTAISYLLHIYSLKDLRIIRNFDTDHGYQRRKKAKVLADDDWLDFGGGAE